MPVIGLYIAVTALYLYVGFYIVVEFETAYYYSVYSKPITALLVMVTTILWLPICAISIIVAEFQGVKGDK